MAESVPLETYNLPKEIYHRIMSENYNAPLQFIYMRRRIFIMEKILKILMNLLVILIKHYVKKRHKRNDVRNVEIRCEE